MRDGEFGHAPLASLETQLEQIIDRLEGRRERHRGDGDMGYATMGVLIGLRESALIGDVLSMQVGQIRFQPDAGLEGGRPTNQGVATGRTTVYVVRRVRAVGWHEAGRVAPFTAKEAALG